MNYKSYNKNKKFNNYTELQKQLSKVHVLDSKLIVLILNSNNKKIVNALYFEFKNFILLVINN